MTSIEPLKEVDREKAFLLECVWLLNLIFHKAHVRTPPAYQFIVITLATGSEGDAIWVTLVGCTLSLDSSSDLLKQEDFSELLCWSEPDESDKTFWKCYTKINR